MNGFLRKAEQNPDASTTHVKERYRKLVQPHSLRHIIIRNGERCLQETASRLEKNSKDMCPYQVQQHLARVRTEYKAL